MSTAQSVESSAHIINGMHEVARHHIGKSLVDVFRNSSVGGQLRKGDYYLDRSYILVQQCFAGLLQEEQDNIIAKIKVTIDLKEGFDSARDRLSIFQRYLSAKDYKRVSKDLFKLVESASRRATGTSLLAQVSETISGRATQAPPMGTTSTHTNPFSDSHEVSSLADVDVDDLDQVEMSTYQSETTGDAVVVLDLHGRDSSIQQVIATFPPEAFVDDDICGEGDSASIHSGQLWGSHSEAGDDAGR